MDNNHSFHVRLLNERVRTMNQSNAKFITLNAQEARSLQSEIYDLMATIADLSASRDEQANANGVAMDGGGFK
jgi:low affinity Fe/Cu permease